MYPVGSPSTTTSKSLFKHSDRTALPLLPLPPPPPASATPTKLAVTWSQVVITWSEVQVTWWETMLSKQLRWTTTCLQGKRNPLDRELYQSSYRSVWAFILLSRCGLLHAWAHIVSVFTKGYRFQHFQTPNQQRVQRKINREQLSLPRGKE